jgi:hypothetical protein
MNAHVTICCAESRPAWMKKKLVCLANISIWERPVDRLRSFNPSGTVKESGVWKHDYSIVIKLKYYGYSFVVEKVAQLQNFEILSCQYVNYRSGGPARGAKCLVGVDLKGAKVPVRFLKNILEEDGNTNDMLSNNGWKYAWETAAKVIMFCGDDPNELKKVERIMPCNALRVFIYPWNPKNLETLAILKIRAMNSIKYKAFHIVARKLICTKDSDSEGMNWLTNNFVCHHYVLYAISIVNFEASMICCAGVRPAWMQKDFVYLANVSIWERPVDHLRSFYPCGKRKGSGVLKHDYVVINLTYGGDSFVVEKVAQRQKHGILNCEYAKFRTGGPASGANCRVDVDLKGARVRVRDLVRIFEEHGDKYNMWSSNCWCYAMKTAEEVIKLCAKDPFLSKTEQRFLKDVIRRKELKRKERIMPRDRRNLVTLGILKIRDMNSIKYKLFHIVAGMLISAKDSDSEGTNIWLMSVDLVCHLSKTICYFIKNMIFEEMMQACTMSLQDFSLFILCS